MHNTSHHPQRAWLPNRLESKPTTSDNTATTWRDLADQLTPAERANLEDLEQTAPPDACDHIEAPIADTAAVRCLALPQNRAGALKFLLLSLDWRGDDYLVLIGA